MKDAGEQGGPFLVEPGEQRVNSPEDRPLQARRRPLGADGDRRADGQLADDLGRRWTAAWSDQLSTASAGPPSIAEGQDRPDDGRRDQTIG